MTGRRERNRTRQRERILRSAWDLFTDHGFDDATMADVATAAGVSRATVFNHFGSKQGLVDAQTERVLLYYQAMLDRALADEATPTPVLLRALASQMGAGIERQPRVQRSVFREIARLQVGFDEVGLTQQANEENHKRLVKLLERGLERGELSPAASPEALASAFVSLVNGTITHWLFVDTSLSLHERMREVTEIFLAGAATDGESSRAHPLPDLDHGPLGETP